MFRVRFYSSPCGTILPSVVCKPSAGLNFQRYEIFSYNPLFGYTTLPASPSTGPSRFTQFTFSSKTKCKVYTIVLNVSRNPAYIGDAHLRSNTVSVLNIRATDGTIRTTITRVVDIVERCTLVQYNVELNYLTQLS